MADASTDLDELGLSLLFCQVYLRTLKLVVLTFHFGYASLFGSLHNLLLFLICIVCLLSFSGRLLQGLNVRALLFHQLALLAELGLYLALECHEVGGIALESLILSIRRRLQRQVEGVRSHKNSWAVPRVQCVCLLQSLSHGLYCQCLLEFKKIFAAGDLTKDSFSVAEQIGNNNISEEIGRAEVHK